MKTQIKIISFNDDVLMFQKWHVPNSDIYNNLTFTCKQMPRVRVGLGLRLGLGLGRIRIARNKMKFESLDGLVMIEILPQFYFQTNDQEISFQVRIPTWPTFQLRYYHINQIQSTRKVKNQIEHCSKPTILYFPTSYLSHFIAISFKLLESISSSSDDGMHLVEIV